VHRLIDLDQDSQKGTRSATYKQSQTAALQAPVQSPRRKKPSTWETWVEHEREDLFVNAWLTFNKSFWSFVTQLPKLMVLCHHLNYLSVSGRPSIRTFSAFTHLHQHTACTGDRFGILGWTDFRTWSGYVQNCPNMQRAYPDKAAPFVYFEHPQPKHIKTIYDLFQPKAKS